MCGSSSSPSGETKYTWSDDMAPRWNNILNVAGNMADPNTHPLNQYPVEARFSPFNTDQTDAMQYTRNMATMSNNPISAMNSARDQIAKTEQGGYLPGHTDANQSAGIMDNPWANQGLNGYAGAENRFGGESPQFQGLLHSGQQDIADAYQRGTSADLTRLMNLSGAFGGSAHQNALANNETALGKTLGQYTSGMQNDQYNRSAGLEESRLGRGSQAAENAIGRGNQEFMQGQQLGSQAYENERGRQLQASGLGQNEQALAYQRIGALAGIGQQQQDFGQKQQDYNYQNWLDQQNYPYKMIDWLTGTYGRAQGGMGANSAMYGNNGSAVTQGLGGLLAAYGLSGM